jgi:hypothetical protein
MPWQEGVAVGLNLAELTLPAVRAEDHDLGRLVVAEIVTDLPS